VDQTRAPIGGGTGGTETANSSCPAPDSHPGSTVSWSSAGSSRRICRRPGREMPAHRPGRRKARVRIQITAPDAAEVQRSRIPGQCERRTSRTFRFVIDRPTRFQPDPGKCARRWAPTILKNGQAQYPSTDRTDKRRQCHRAARCVWCCGAQRHICLSSIQGQDRPKRIDVQVGSRTATVLPFPEKCRPANLIGSRAASGLRDATCDLG